MKNPRRILKVFVGLLLFSLLLQLAFNPFFQPYLQPSYWSTMSKFGEALRIVHVAYVDDDQAELDQLSDDAMVGMLQSLDKYSNYLPANEYDAYRKSSRMEFEGIGVEVQELQERITVVRVFEGGSAKESGIFPEIGSKRWMESLFLDSLYGYGDPHQGCTGYHGHAESSKALAKT